MSNDMTGELWVVATPIGHMDDVSSRARNLLADADLIACEDTRHSGRLLSALGISTPMISYHDHNESERASGLLERLLAGENIALISDAGTPLVSDPGYRLVKLAVAEGIRVVPVPGPSALLAALVVAGLPTDRFRFLGFPPASASARRSWYQALADETDTVVFYESCHRLAASLEDAAEILNESRPAAVCRELTKRHETVLHGDLASLRDRVAADPDQRRGEMVVVLGGIEESQENTDQNLARAVEIAGWLDEHLPTGQAAKLAARISGQSRKEIYSRLLEND